jgi:hypothetical protein
MGSPNKQHGSVNLRYINRPQCASNPSFKERTFLSGYMNEDKKFKIIPKDAAPLKRVAVDRQSEKNCAPYFRMKTSSQRQYARRDYG